MTQAMQMNDLVAEFTGKGVEALRLWADLNQIVLRQLVDFTAGTAQEGMRLYADLQLAAVEAMKDSQGFMLRRQADAQEAMRDPIGVYQRSVVDWIDGTQRTFKLFEGAGQALTRSAERVQSNAERTAKELQAGFTHWSDELRSLYASPAASSPASREGRVRGQQKPEAA